MRIILIAVALIGATLSTPASAQHMNFGPMIAQILRPMMAPHGYGRPVQYAQPVQYGRPVQQMPFHATGTLPDGCNPSDINAGGTCGTEAASWCNTDVMLHRPVRQDCYSPSVNNGALNGGYGVQARGNRGGRGQPTMQQSTQTTIVTWHTHTEGRRFDAGLQQPMVAGPAAPPIHVGVSGSERAYLQSVYQ